MTATLRARSGGGGTSSSSVWVTAFVCASWCFASVHAAPFADGDALKLAVDNCLGAVPSGEKCCSEGGADCGAAGTADMPDWDTSMVTDMNNLFSSYRERLDGTGRLRSSWFNQDIGGWDTSRVTNMRMLFAGNEINADISGWDTSQVTDMSEMFYSNRGFNQNIGGWDVSNVTDMDYMFGGNEEFNQDIGGWDVSSVGSMSGMFSGARAFNQDISRWDVSSVSSTWYMFNDADSFQQDITGWTLSDGATVGYMFQGATRWTGAFVNCGMDDSDGASCSGAGTYDLIANSKRYRSGRGGDLDALSYFDGPPGAWAPFTPTSCTQSAPFSSYGALVAAISRCLAAVPSGENCCSSGAAECGSACKVDMPDWDVSRVTRMDFLLKDREEFNQDISRWNVSEVTSMSYMFEGCLNFNQDISGWNVSSVSTMRYMFRHANVFDRNITGWNTKDDVDADDMFAGADGWFAAFSNCAHNSSLAVCDGMSNVSDVDVFDGPPSFWKRSGCSLASHSLDSGNRRNFWSQGTEGNICVISYPGYDYINVVGLPLNSTCEPYCSGSYVSSPTVCSADGELTHVSECLMMCVDFPAPSHGNVGDCPRWVPGGVPLDSPEAAKMRKQGETCQPGCDVGYTPSGPATCLANATFSQVRCLPNGCDTPTPPANGRAGDCTSEMASGAQCQFECDPGFVVSGPTSCRAGALTLATCVVPAPPPPPPKLILDEEDGAERLGVIFAAITASLSLLLFA